MLDWYDALERFASATGRIVAVGPTDVGKSTWIQAVASHHVGTTAVVSGDPGQAIVGAPGLLATVAPDDRQRSPWAQRPTAVYFLGRVRPNDRPAQLIEGVRALTEATHQASPTVLIDTDGHVAGRSGRDGKQLLLAALAPCTAVFFGDDPALAPLLAWSQARPDIESVRVTPPIERRERTAGERRDNRRAAARTWLDGAQRHLVRLDRGLVLSAGTGLGPALDARTRAAMGRTLGIEPIHAELAREALALVVDRELDDADCDRLREELEGRSVRTTDVRQWLGCTIGDFGNDGLSAGMGVVDDWQLEPPGLIVRGRFLKEPGRVWQLGDVID